MSSLQRGDPSFQQGRRWWSTHEKSASSITGILRDRRYVDYGGEVLDTAAGLARGVLANLALAFSVSLVGHQGIPASRNLITTKLALLPVNSVQRLVSLLYYRTSLQIQLTRCGKEVPFTLLAD